MPLTHICDKAGKIDSMEADLKTLKRVVLEGNGQKGLVQLITELNDQMKPINDSVIMMSSNVTTLMDFQNKLETSRDLKNEARLKRINRNRWIVGTIIAIGTLLTVILSNVLI